MAFVRSPEAHATITSIDAQEAMARDDVIAVFTGDDLGDLQAPLPMAWVPPGVEINAPEHWPLAKGRVAHVGDPVAVVIGEDRYSVVDAAELVVVEYEPLPVVVDPEEALKDEVLVHPDLSSNKVHEWSLGGGDLDAGFAEADVIIERRVVNHRTAGGAIEPRAVLAEERAGHLTLWSSTQVPHFLRLFLAIILGLSEERIRVIAPEVGGGFGSKLQIYGEEIMAAWAARKLGRPVKWVETRSEGMMVTHHGRDQIATVRVGAKRDGKVTAFHAQDPRRPGRLPDAAHADRAVAGRVRDERLLRVPRGADRHHRRDDEQVRHRRDPRRGPAGGDAHDRGRHGPARRGAGHGPAGAAAAQLHPRRRLPLRDGAGDRLRLRQLPGHAWRSCWSTSTTTGSAPSRSACETIPPTPSTAGSGSAPTRRSAAWRHRASSAPAGSACRPAAGSRRSCACT